MTFNDYPGYKEVVLSVEKLIKPVDELLDIYRDEWANSMFSFDFEWFDGVTDAITTSMEILNQCIDLHQEKFDEFLEAGRKLSETNNSFTFNSEDYEVDFILDILSPLLAKKVELSRAKAHISTFIT